MKSRILTACSIVIAGAIAARAGTLYTATPLGVGYSFNDVNNPGEVAGSVGNFLSGIHAALFSNAMTLDLGALPGGFYSGANGNNDAGEVVGYSYIGGVSVEHAFLYTNGVMMDLGTLPAYPGSSSEATGINNSGQVVGSVVGPGPEHAFLYSNGVMTDLGMLPGATGSFAAAINNSGQVTGASGQGSVGHAFLWSNGVMTDLGTLGGPGSSGTAINNSGQVVGTSTTSSSLTDGFLYSNGVMTDLGVFQPYGINDSGQIVGSAPVSGQAHAIVYSNGVMTDLNSALATSLPGIMLMTATAINEAGQIVAEASGSTGNEGFLLTPVAVPEPFSVVLTASGLLAIVLVRGWNRRTARRMPDPAPGIPFRTRRHRKSTSASTASNADSERVKSVSSGASKPGI